MRPARTALVVLGVHRSGTSAMARVLNLAGLGALPGDLVPPHPVDNPNGFWEARPIIELNDAILADMGGRWDRPPGPGKIKPSYVDRAVDLLAHQYEYDASLVLKDPRMTLLVPLWHEALGRLSVSPRYIVMVRHPAEVVASLGARDGLGREEAASLWMSYVSAACVGTYGLPRTFVAYERLIADWREVLERFASISRDALIPGTAAARAIDAFVSPKHRRKRSEDLPAALGGKKAEQIFSALLAQERTARRSSASAWTFASPRVHTEIGIAERSGTDATWLLVTGAPRSGTSLLRAILTEHPRIGLLQEYGLTSLVKRIDAIVDRPRPASADWDSADNSADARFNAAARFYRDRAGRAAVTRGGGDPGPEQFGSVARGLFEGLFPGKNLGIIGDKMPMASAWEDLTLLFTRLPGLKVVAVIRNPVDVIRSSLVRRAATQRGLDAWPIQTVDEAVAQWIAAWRTLKSIRTRHGSALMVVKYNDLFDQPGNTAAALYAWLGLAPHAVTTPISALPPDLAQHTAHEQAVIERHLGPIIGAWPMADAETLMSSYDGPPPPYVLGEPISLSWEDASAYLVSGFSFREDWGRWTDGRRAAVLIFHGLARGLLLVEVGIVQAFVIPGETCDVVVRCGWSEPKLFHLSPQRSRIVFLAMAEEAQDRGSLSFELLIVRPKSADEPPADSRALGILVETITISRLPDAELNRADPPEAQR